MNHTPFPEQDSDVPLEGNSDFPFSDSEAEEVILPEGNESPIDLAVFDAVKQAEHDVQVHNEGDSVSPDEEFNKTEPNDQPFDLSILDDPELVGEAPSVLDDPDILAAEKAIQEAMDAENTPEGYLSPEEQAFRQEFSPEALPENPEENEETEVPSMFEEHPMQRKGRPKHKKGEGLFGIPNILVTMVWLALTVLIGVTLGRMIWICAADVLAFGQEDRQVTITVYETDSIEDITEKLFRARLIQYPGLFKLYAKFAVDEGEIHPGIWDLNAKYDYHALVKMMTPSSSREVVTVLIPEGYTCRQIFTTLEENKICTVQDIAAYAANGELDEYWFLEDVVRGDKYCLEGFLFPDTYEFYKNDSPRNVLQKMLNNFDVRFDEEMRWQIDQLNGQMADLMRANGRSDSYIAEHTLSLRDIVTVASMIEKETATSQESFKIASVIYNRLFNWGGTPAFLNIDATIIYALDGKTGLTAEDLKVDSPYNTYTNIGLTPGPISNPGLNSIHAALEPEKTNYYFYVLDPSAGTHHFSRTQEEHEAFRASLAK